MWPEFHHHYRHHHLISEEPLRLRPTLYAEFLWADFLRTRIGLRSALKATPAAVRAGVKLARSPAARYLPGWAGRDP
jgi:hypothetical protein